MSSLVLAGCFHQEEVPSVGRDFSGFAAAQEAGREDHVLLSTCSAECVQAFGVELGFHMTLRLTLSHKG